MSDFLANRDIAICGFRYERSGGSDYSRNNVLECAIRNVWSSNIVHGTKKNHSMLDTLNFRHGKIM